MIVLQHTNKCMSQISPDEIYENVCLVEHGNVLLFSKIIREQVENLSLV